MKKILYFIIAILIFASCGPRRLKCGARGICKTPTEKAISKAV